MDNQASKMRRSWKLSSCPTTLSCDVTYCCDSVHDGESLLRGVLKFNSKLYVGIDGVQMLMKLIYVFLFEACVTVVNYVITSLQLQLQFLKQRDCRNAG